jgi:VanZ family protein
VLQNKGRILLMKKIKIIRMFLLICIIAWAYIVFSFSSQDGNESSGLSRMVVDFFIKDPQIADKVEPYVRKMAHFCEYALGGTLFLSLLYTSSESK